MVSPPPSASLPQDYPRFLAALKARIRSARVRAVLAVNHEVIDLYWDLGRRVVERQQQGRWGSGIIARISRDIRTEFPGIKGFSRANIQRMRAFFLAWTRNGSLRRQPVDGAEIAMENDDGSPICAQPVRKLGGERVPPLLGGLPWGHNIILIEYLRTPRERLWYATKAIQEAWSRDMLLRQIETGLRRRQGRAQTNFALTLPAPQARLAQEALKDEYALDFLAANNGLEKDLEQSIIENAQRFLMELGTGFAFIGRQVRLKTHGREHVVDLLFYNTLLHSHVVVELKAGPFQPEHISKLSSYLAAADEVLRHDGDQPSIGVILCRSKNRIVVEFALRDQRRPIGVACYRLTRHLPVRMKEALPTALELETGLQSSRARRRRPAARGLPRS